MSQEELLSPCHKVPVRASLFGSPKKPKLKYICTYCGNPVIMPDTKPEGWRYARPDEVSMIRGRNMPRPQIKAVDVPEPDVVREKDA